MARLKVFITSDGFTDYVVAATSRAKALAAWGAHQDLFQTGGAHETDDPDLVAAASEQPGHVLRRPSKVTPLIPKRAATAKPPPPSPRPQPPKPRGPTPAQLRKVADLEAELEAAAERHSAELAQIVAEKRALELRRDESESRFLARRAELREALRKARLALR
ncbi:MAG: hypothetical protein C0481_06690 [Phenylobacterium sp.]|uniref:hypothetical protein n=1 Tax=Phenylobacterium sp. TaxID=1871053 RepID=UPI0025DF32D2|nr:hypothetical protein [Phenylobacterium sp.]MBA4011537.1 hypothetical protein [Phenylobacterium sp.]